jgi:hypothetical protein
MAAQYTITVRCTVAWWFRPYAVLLMAFATITRRMPSDAHIERVVQRAVRTELIERG